jgi:hypothetical protein
VSGGGGRGAGASTRARAAPLSSERWRRRGGGDGGRPLPASARWLPATPLFMGSFCDLCIWDSGRSPEKLAFCACRAGGLSTGLALWRLKAPEIARVAFLGRSAVVQGQLLRHGPRAAVPRSVGFR